MWTVDAAPLRASMRSRRYRMGIPVLFMLPNICRRMCRKWVGGRTALSLRLSVSGRTPGWPP